jgi:hypothetical protein
MGILCTMLTDKENSSFISDDPEGAWVRQTGTARAKVEPVMGAWYSRMDERTLIALACLSYLPRKEKGINVHGQSALVT